LLVEAFRFFGFKFLQHQLTFILSISFFFVVVRKRAF